HGDPQAKSEGNPGNQRIEKESTGARPACFRRDGLRRFRADVQAAKKGSMTVVHDNCRRVLDRIHDAAAKSHRDPAAIRLIAVTKTVPAERIREAIETGIREVGENRLQEALSKRPALKTLPVKWHFIGHLQSNKARKVAENFDCVQSVDRLDVAQKLNQYAPPS